MLGKVIRTSFDGHHPEPIAGRIQELRETTPGRVPPERHDTLRCREWEPGAGAALEQFERSGGRAEWPCRPAIAPRSTFAAHSRLGVSDAALSERPGAAQEGAAMRGRELDVRRPSGVSSSTSGFTFPLTDSRQQLAGRNADHPPPAQLCPHDDLRAVRCMDRANALCIGSQRMLAQRLEGGHL